MKKERTAAALLLAAVIVTALNLRAPITGVGTLSGVLQRELGLSGFWAGSLTAIPLLAFAFVSPFVVRLAGRLGAGRSLLWGMVLIAAGCAVRSWLGSAGLLLGTVVIGAGICCGNVLLPVVVKDRWPDRIGPMTGVYTTAQSIFAGLSSAICVPLSRLPALGWRGALGIWAVPALAAAVLWLPRRDWVLPLARTEGASSRVLRSRVAWSCTIYMGTQAFLYYSFVAWLPAILASKGVESAAAGYMTSVYQLIGIAANFLAPTLAGKMRDQRPLTGAVGVMYIAGALLLWRTSAPLPLFLAVLLCGMSTGCAFSLCMAFIGMRTRTAADASRLSGMLQTVGYAIAALGPVLIGRLLDASGSWALPMAALFAGVAVNSLVGLLAGKPGFVE